MIVCQIQPEAVVPEHHHVERVVCEAGDERGQRDDEHDGQQEVRAAVGAGPGAGVALAAWDTPAAGVELRAAATETEHEKLHITVNKFFIQLLQYP